MKLKNRILAFATAVAMVATGCVKDNPNYQPDNGTDNNENTGYLDLASINANVMLDTEMQPQLDTQSATRAVHAADGTYLVRIYNADDEMVLDTTVGDLRTHFTDNLMELPVGNYRLQVLSKAIEPDQSWDLGYYSTDPYYEFSVTSANTKENPKVINDGSVVCKLQSVKVTVELTEDLKQHLSTNTYCVIDMEGNNLASATYSMTETRAAYLKTANPDGDNTLNFLLSGEKDGVPATLERTITGVRKGQWRKIVVSIAYATTGEAVINVDVKTLVQDEELVISGTEGWTEPTLDEGTDLGLVWENHDLATDTYSVTDADYDENGGFIANNAPALKLTSKNGIQSVLLTVTSTCADFADVVEGVDLCGTVTSIKPTMYRPLRIAEANATEAVLDFNKIMDDFYCLQGNYSFTFEMTDVKGKTATETLNMTYGEAEDPSITCAQFPISTPKVIKEGDEIDVNISSTTGITKFLVTIESETLDETTLGAVGLQKTFDLCNIEEGSRLATSLTSETIGFPINDDVKGKTYLPFPLTKFVGMLIAFPGSHAFTLTVENESGASTTKTLTLVVE